jgi:hypothetical protein
VPVIIPLEEPIVATAVLVLLQFPPEVASERVILDVSQMVAPPVTGAMDAEELIVTEEVATAVPQILVTE